ncbi:uncharacterized protein TNCV_3533561 [Trichonephila clavipes]|nr:uncharacterized protein TNCV_3533561 [Trichonephila clavipes]
MITNFFIPELNNHDVQELWFQQDGTTCHTARATIDLLKDTFGDRIISRFGPVNWPPRSCDLTPLDYFLRGYVKSLVYADKPQTLDHLEDNIRRVIADIRPQMLEKVIENWTSRLDYIRASRGSPMPEIIFKMIWSENPSLIILDIKPSCQILSKALAMIGVNVSCGSSCPWWRASNLNGCWYVDRGRGKLVPGVGDRMEINLKAPIDETPSKYPEKQLQWICSSEIQNSVVRDWLGGVVVGGVDSFGEKVDFTF